MKQYVIYSVTLGIAWCFLHGAINLPNFLVGLVLGFLVIRPFRELYDFDEQATYSDFIRRIPKLGKYLSILMVEIIKASIVVAKIVLQPKMNINPGIIAVPVRTTKDVSITAIANTITLTPGTLTIDVSDDRSALYVHSIDVSDPKGLSDSIRDDLEEYVLEAFE
ncbi:multicomponent Na+:H+ antiporter subunit E [Methanohalophilus levihalophilus]|uniref:Na+/H+ antiporter subunit E n=1 Tax=Methanohalophilus levihalophilus TaxID=1431282 RepID=UPI001AE9B62D|nr:Na+/H+ antiporter subunit E [Methanohalophilus levihalophilus]MBP2031300.1 multicomponent Na+:H+ antiporter subunit E [Methanohalophilus levihalophilus]